MLALTAEVLRPFCTQKRQKCHNPSVPPPVSRLVHVIGVPLDLGAGRRGVDMGPSAVRIAGLAERLSAMSCQVVDQGNLPTPIPETQAQRDPTKKYIRDIARVCQKLYTLVRQSHTAGALPLVLGGDHSLAAGSVGGTADFAASRGESVGLLWIDAHGDMNTPATTTSGNVHGMPLAALLGPEPAELSQIGERTPKVEAARTVIIGVRNLDDLEKQRIRDSRVHLFTMKDIDRDGIAVVMERALAIATDGTLGVHVSFDLDVCDPSIAPGVGTPVKGGLDYREAHLAMEMVADSGRLLALDLVEVNPVLDVQNQTAMLAVELALSALGQRII
jgi:arginase